MYDLYRVYQYKIIYIILYHDICSYHVYYLSLIIYISFYLVIFANFEKSLYRVHGHNGSITPKIILTEPPSCDLVVRTRLAVLGELNDVCVYICSIYMVNNCDIEFIFRDHE